jgi:hypothetical protein
MDNKDIKGMATIYDVYAQVDGLKVLCTAFKVHVEASFMSRIYEHVVTHLEPLSAGFHQEDRHRAHAR